MGPCHQGLVGRRRRPGDASGIPELVACAEPSSCPPARVAVVVGMVAGVRVTRCGAVLFIPSTRTCPTAEGANIIGVIDWRVARVGVRLLLFGHGLRSHHSWLGAEVDGVDFLARRCNRHVRTTTTTTADAIATANANAKTKTKRKTKTNTNVHLPPSPPTPILHVR